uniref:Uncharacterized protein n=1 Tax=Amphimedon queenslandica TaxID=400682 RepID=A0A1X7SSX8_AMPQE
MPSLGVPEVVASPRLRVTRAVQLVLRESLHNLRRPLVLLQVLLGLPVLKMAPWLMLTWSFWASLGRKCASSCLSR